MLRLCLLALALVVGSGLCGLHSGNQRYSVRMKLMCGAAPAKNTQVKLMEHDTGKLTTQQS